MPTAIQTKHIAKMKKIAGPRSRLTEVLGRIDLIEERLPPGRVLVAHDHDGSRIDAGVRELHRDRRDRQEQRDGHER